MWNGKKRLALSPAVLFVLSSAAAAQEDQAGMLSAFDGFVEAGVGWVSEDSFKFGQFTGLEESGAYFIGNVEATMRSPYDGDSTTYFELRGRDLGLDSRSVYVEGGRQGSFSIFGEYDAIPHLRFDDGQTPYLGAGGTDLTLPPGWTQGGSTATLTDLNASLRDLEVKTERERIGAGFSININPNWTFSTAFRSEQKDGIETTAGIFGSTGGNMRAAILPRPVDFTTNEAEAAISYSSQRMQADIRYNLSLFDNNKDSLTWDNAYTNFNPTGDGEGRMALEPDNSAHHLSAALGYMLGERTRLSGSLSLGHMVQDDSFLPYTVNPNLTAPAALPRDSLDGEVNTIHANVGLTTRPTQKTDVKVAYTYDDRDNQTPVDTYLTVPNDSVNQGTPADARARRNMPYSRQTHNVELEAGYRLTLDTKLTASYDFEAISRDLQEVDDTREHTIGAKVRSSLTESTSGYLSYDFARRTGSTYDTTLPFLVSHDPAYLSGLVLPGDAYEQNPYLRKFYIADRDQHLVKGGLNWFPSEEVTVGLNGSYNSADYDATIGLTGSSYLSGTFDVSYAPTGKVSFTGYVTAEQINYQQTGYERGAAAILPGDPLDPALLWDLESTENAYTAGVEIGFAAIPDKLDVVVDAAYSDSTIAYDIATQVAGVTPLPDLTSRLISAGVRGDYHASDGITLRLGYRYEALAVDDFALADVDEIIAPAVFGLGNGEPDYHAHIVTGSVVVQF